jgi:lipid II:glycine glycyltransferase (peptidoglycan interpeptide bridge formation enzyme)
MFFFQISKFYFNFNTRNNMDKMKIFKKRTKCRNFVVKRSWAIERGFHRLELTVNTHNERAIRLYKKMGFEVEGVKKLICKWRIC